MEEDDQFESFKGRDYEEDNSNYSQKDDLEEGMEEPSDFLVAPIPSTTRGRQGSMRVRPGTIMDSRFLEEDGSLNSRRLSTTSTTRRASALLNQEVLIQQLLAKKAAEEKSKQEHEPADKQDQKINDEVKARTKIMKIIKPNRKKMTSLVFHRKNVYTYLSLVFGVLLLIIMLYERISLFIYQVEPVTTKYLGSFLIIHVLSFYLFLIGFIYANESGEIGSFILACITGCIFCTTYLLF